MASANDILYREDEKFSNEKGAKRVIKVSLKTKIYTSGGYTYVCEAKAGSNLTDAVWRISRVDSSGNVDQADGDDSFDNVATDEATVAGLTYS